MVETVIPNNQSIEPYTIQEMLNATGLIGAAQIISPDVVTVMIMCKQVDNGMSIRFVGPPGLEPEILYKVFTSAANSVLMSQPAQGSG